VAIEPVAVNVGNGVRETLGEDVKVGTGVELELGRGD
jgi:hypothetical protein